MAHPVDEIHDFWFGELDEAGLCIEDRNRRWFGSDEETDEACRERFHTLLEHALAGELDEWADSDRGLVALVVLLDQFSRNIHRGSKHAFGGDEKALALALDAVDSGRHLGMPAIHRVFLYLPLEHSEDLAIQERCVDLFKSLENEAGKPLFEGFSRYAVAHRDVILKFGRFPHRNALLGRDSSAEELAYLEKHGGF